MLVNSLTKEIYYILYTKDKNVTTIEVTDLVLFENIWKFYDYLLSLTLDKNS